MIVTNKIVYPAHLSVRKPPLNLEEIEVDLFQHEYKSSICKTTLLSLKRCDILQDTIFDLSSFKFYASYTHINGSFTIIDKLSKLKLFFKSKVDISHGIWITQNWTWMYFHWMTDALTRLMAVENEGGEYPVLLPEEYKRFPYIVESLELLGYRHVWYTSNQRFRIKELLLPSHTASPGNYNGFFLNRLRNRFLVTETVSHRKIFISRRKASQRYITNEEEVVSLVLSFGFEVHVFEDYSLTKQISLLSETNCLLGLHGAGLTNMLFMPSGGKVLEIRNKGDRHNNCYFSMASELNHSYYYMQSDGDSSQTASVNLCVDAQQLTNLLRNIFVAQTTK